MRFIRQFHSQTFNINASSVQELKWKMSEFASVYGKFYAHVAGFGFRVNGTVANAAAGAAVTGRDTGAILGNCTMARNDTTKQVDTVPGDCLIHRETVKSGGVLPYSLPGIAAGGGGGQNTTLANVDFFFTFDEPHAENPGDLVRPITDYKPAGFITCAPALLSSLQASLSWSGTATIQAFVLLSLSDTVKVGADVRIGVMTDTLNIGANNTRTGLLLSAGVYRRLLLDSPAATGFPVPRADLYSQIASLNQPIRFPVNPSLTSTDYNNIHALQSAITNSAESGNLINSGTVAVLISPPSARGRASDSALWATEDVNFQLALGGTGVGSHRFVFERAYDQDAAAIMRSAQKAGIKQARPVFQFGDSARPTSDPARNVFVPVELKTK